MVLHGGQHPCSLSKVQVAAPALATQADTWTPLPSKLLQSHCQLPATDGQTSCLEAP